MIYVLEDDASIRESRGIVDGTLLGLKVDVYWIPPRDNSSKTHGE
jgi:hypothetical protein